MVCINERCAGGAERRADCPYTTWCHGDDGFHAGEMAWVVFQEAPGQAYQCSQRKIKVAALVDGCKVLYELWGIGKKISSSRVFRTAEEAQACYDRLNRQQKRKKAKAQN